MGSFGCHLSLSLSLSLSMCVSACFSHFNLISSPHFTSPLPLPLPLPLTLPPSLHSPILLLFSFLQSIVILLLGNCSVYPSPQFRWTRLSQLLVSQPTSPHLTSLLDHHSNLFEFFHPILDHSSLRPFERQAEEEEK